jgi:asparagine synthase (glutamine-hydrolysing)
VLPKVDRMSMQHALEVRAPFLGRKVADFAARMAADDLCRPDQTKILLKHLAARYVPRAWIDQPKKGFGLPMQGWGGSELTNAVATLLEDPACCLGKWIDAPARTRFLDFHRATPATYQLWAIYILELWLRANMHRVA